MLRVIDAKEGEHRYVVTGFSYLRPNTTHHEPHRREILLPTLENSTYFSRSGTLEIWEKIKRILTSDKTGCRAGKSLIFAVERDVSQKVSRCKAQNPPECMGLHAKTNPDLLLEQTIYLLLFVYLYV